MHRTTCTLFPSVNYPVSHVKLPVSSSSTFVYYQKVEQYESLHRCFMQSSGPLPYLCTWFLLMLLVEIKQLIYTFSYLWVTGNYIWLYFSVFFFYVSCCVVLCFLELFLSLDFQFLSHNCIILVTLALYFKILSVLNISWVIFFKWIKASV